MAESIALKLKINGNDVQGESSIASSAGQDRTNTIECVYFEQQAMTPRDPTSGRSSVASRQLLPIVVHKRIDKSSPLLIQALCQNQNVEGEFWFFRPNPDDGTTQFFFKVKIEQARVASVKLLVENTMDADASNRPPMEQVSFSYAKITWTSVSGSTEFTDEWSQRG